MRCLSRRAGIQYDPVMFGQDQAIVVTGVGPVCAVGIGADAVWDSLAAGRTRVTTRELLFDVGRPAQVPIAAMPPHDDVPGLAAHLDFLSRQESPGHRDLAYALLAIELALKDARLEFGHDQNSVGMVQAFEAPGVEATVTRLFQMMGMLAPPGDASAPHPPADAPSDAVPPMSGPPGVYEMLAPSFYTMQPFVYVHLAGKAFRLHGYCTSVHNACSSGAFAIEVAAQQLRSGRAEAMIVVGGEGFDTAVRLEWFRRLELYAREPVLRPFDPAGSGFYVGEGAAAIVLETAEHAARRTAPVYARYVGGAFAHQGWKQTIPDVRSGRLAVVVREAIKAAGVEASALDLIVPHGAATNLSDGYEADCLRQAIAGGATRAVATVFKPYFGHMLAASGIIETVAGLLALKHQCVPASPFFNGGGATLPVPLVSRREDRPLHTLLKMFTGFTGHDAALVFQRTL